MPLVVSSCARSKLSQERFRSRFLYAIGFRGLPLASTPLYRKSWSGIGKPLQSIPVVPCSARLPAQHLRNKAKVFQLPLFLCLGSQHRQRRPCPLGSWSIQLG